MQVLIHEWVTGGGLGGKEIPATLAAEGLAMKRALIREFARVSGVRVVTTLDARLSESDPTAETFLVPEGEEEAVFARLVRDCDFTLVIAPETNDVLAARAELIQEVGGHSLGSSPESIRLTADKFEFANHLNASRIPTPPTRKFRTDSGLPRDMSYPVVVKPVDGAGSVHTFICDFAEDFVFDGNLPEEMLIQPLMMEQSISASFFVAVDSGPVCLSVGWQSVVVEEKSFRYQGGVLMAPWDWSAQEPLAAVRSVPGLHGWVGVDFLRGNADTPHIILEINPRPTTSIVGVLPFYEPGAIAGAWLMEAAGRAFILPKIQRSKGLRFLADGTILDD